MHTELPDWKKSLDPFDMPQADQCDCWIHSLEFGSWNRSIYWSRPSVFDCSQYAKTGLGM